MVQVPTRLFEALFDWQNENPKRRRYSVQHIGDLITLCLHEIVGNVPLAAQDIVVRRVLTTERIALAETDILFLSAREMADELLNMVAGAQSVVSNKERELQNPRE